MSVYVYVYVYLYWEGEGKTYIRHKTCALEILRANTVLPTPSTEWQAVYARKRRWETGNGKWKSAMQASS